VVNGLTRLEALVPAVQALGRRHAGYGVADEHYDIVAEALLWTLQQGLSEYFTPDVAAAWSTAYGILADVMKAAAAEVEEAILVPAR
jgi:hemoglobin-like flavoprotein